MIETVTEEMRQLDIDIAVELFGAEWWRSASSGNRGLFLPGTVPSWFHERADGQEGLCAFAAINCPYYSTNRTAWLDVVKKLEEMGLVLSLISAVDNLSDRVYHCCIARDTSEDSEISETFSGKSFAHAVSIAALDAIRTLNTQQEDR